LLTAIGLTPGGSSTVYIYALTVHRTTQLTQIKHRTNKQYIEQTIHRTNKQYIEQTNNT